VVFFFWKKRSKKLVLPSSQKAGFKPNLGEEADPGDLGACPPEELDLYAVLILVFPEKELSKRR
jgi:hypothetical protein